MFDSSNVSRDNVSREIGRMPLQVPPENRRVRVHVTRVTSGVVHVRTCKGATEGVRQCWMFRV